MNSQTSSATLTASPSTVERHQSARMWRDVIGFVFLYAQLTATVFLVPSWSPAHLHEPVYFASHAAVATVIGISLIRALGWRGSRSERALLAAFLAGMPIIYLSSWLLTPQSGWLPVELGGLALFGSLAVLGWQRSPWFLAVGIVAHGLFWDASHLGRTSFIPDWYAIGCLVADIGLGVYTALQVSAFQDASRRCS